MQKTAILFLLILVLASCGIKEADKEYMKDVLSEEITLLYQEEGIIPQSLEVEINSLKESNQGKKEYHGTFHCSFIDQGARVSVHGMAVFTEEMGIKRLQHIGQNVRDISVSVVSINGLPVEKKGNKYILDSFF